MNWRRRSEKERIEVAEWIEGGYERSWLGGNTAGMLDKRKEKPKNCR